jgi:DNA anti-recombination protein RmuC
MKYTSIVILAGTVLLHGVAFAASDCHVVDYGDHYEAVCVGDKKPETAMEHKAAQTTSQTAANKQDTAISSAAAKTPTEAKEASKAEKLYTQRLQYMARVEAAMASRMKLMKEERQKRLNDQNGSNPAETDMP